MAPHYDVVHDGLDELVERMLGTSHGVIDQGDDDGQVHFVEVPSDDPAARALLDSRESGTA